MAYFSRGTQVRDSGTSGQHFRASSIACLDHSDPPRTTYTVSHAARRVLNGNTSSYSHNLRALVDRGANGGIAGPNMRLLRWAEGAVDIHGIDNHRVSATRLGSFGAVIKTHLRERIGIWHQMASMPQGRTILSPPQMEAHRVTVNEKSPHVTGRTPTLVDANGYIAPMEIRDGLAYLPIRLPTDSEWKSMPRISFTTDAEWKPKRLDASIPDDWYERQDRFNLYLRDSQFTEDGQLKESVLHAEAPDDMPERDDKEASRVDRDTIRCYLHNQIRHDIDDIFVYNVVNRDVYEHRLTASERREVDQLRSSRLRHVHDANTRPRRSTAKYSTPSGPSPSRQPHRSGGQSSRQPKNSTTKATETRDPPPIQTTDESVDDLQAPTDGHA